jgi:hypothetical protein
MKRIDLAKPFESIVAALSSLPVTGSRVSPRTQEVFKQRKVKHLLRDIYEAANGRQVATTVGLLPIAPPIAPYLKEKPFYVETQAEFLSQALARLADSKRAGGLAPQAEFQSTRSVRAKVTSNAPEHTSDSRRGSCMRVE